VTGSDRAARTTGEWGRPRATAVAMVVVGLGCAALYPVLRGTSQPGWVGGDPARNPARERLP